MNYNKIVVIQTAFLGDVIMSTPLIRALREVFSSYEIDVLTIPETSIIFKECPYITIVLVFDKRKSWRKIVFFRELVFALRKRNYDLAVSIQSSLTSSFLMLLERIPIRVGFARQKLVTIPVTHERGLHIRERYIYLMKPFSEKKFDLQTEIFWSNNEEQKARKIVHQYRDDSEFLVGVAPGSVNTKRWLKEFFATLSGLLEKNNNKIILIGEGEDRLLCEETIEKSNSNALNLAGNLSVLESAAVIQKLDLMITNDSAPLHIANAVKTDVIAFFGQTRKPWVSMDANKLQQSIREQGFDVEKYSFHEIFNQNPDIRNSIILYTFNQKINRRDYIKDVVYYLDNGSNILIPSYDLLLCHENKGFQELFKKKIHLTSLNSYYFSSM